MNKSQAWIDRLTDHGANAFLKHEGGLGFFSYKQQKSAQLFSAKKSTRQMGNRTQKSRTWLNLDDPFGWTQALRSCPGFSVACETRANSLLRASLIFRKEAIGSDKTAIRLRFVIFKCFCVPGLFSMTLAMAKEKWEAGHPRLSWGFCAARLSLWPKLRWKYLPGGAPVFRALSLSPVGVSKSHVTSY